MCGASIESLSVVTAQDRSLVTFTDGQIDGPGGSRDQWNRGWLVAFADDAQRAVTTFEGEVLHVGAGRFAHAQPVQPEQHGEGGVVVVEALRGEQEHPKLRPIETATLARVNLRAAYVLGEVG